MGNNDVSQRMFEKSSQQYFKETWELFWSILGVGVALLLVFGGIYFSEIAIARIFGEKGFTLYFDWGCSIIISCLEVAGIKLLGNADRSRDIKSENALEHKLVNIGTYLLFGFDILTNWYGLAISAIAIGTKLTVIPICFVGFFGGLMAVSEIFVGWMIRASSVSYAGWSYARTKYVACKEYLEKEALKNGHVDDVINKSQRPQNQPSFRPESNVEGDIDRFVDKKFNPNLQPALARGGQYRGNSNHNGPRG